MSLFNNIAKFGRAMVPTRDFTVTLRLSSDITNEYGIDVLRNPSTNKGTGFTIRERQLLRIHGLVPPAYLSLNQQVQKMLANLHKMTDNLQRYSFLNGLQDRNENLFYKLIIDHIEYCLPLIYTPTVGLACKMYGQVFQRPRGLYITIHDKGHILSILDNWPHSDVRVIVVTDGERILGLGDLGAYGMGIPIGKLSLYTALAGVHPRTCLPVMLDVGTDNNHLLTEDIYTGIRHKRIRDGRYDELVDEFMKAVVKCYGLNCLVQFEDFANHNAFRLLERYQHDYCTFNDDIQGTASVALAGLLAAFRLTGNKIKENVYLFVGAGEAATGIAHLLTKFMTVVGLSEKDAYHRVYMFDKDGLLVNGRSEGTLTNHNKRFARNDVEPNRDLLDVVRRFKPTVLIGASGQGGIFTDEILTAMGENNEHPIIFSLSNPTSNSECTAEKAYKMTQGRCVFTSGSPFDQVEMEVAGQKKIFQPGQCNNSYIFPGMGLAITGCLIRPIPNDLFICAAQALASLVNEEDLKFGRVFPPIRDIRRVSLNIALQVAEMAYERELSHLRPKPQDLLGHLKGQMYAPDYVDCVPKTYDWPAKAFGIEE